MLKSLQIRILGSAALLSAAALLAGCGSSSSAIVGPSVGAADRSSLTEVDVQLPDRSGLKAQVADIETKMNGYQLTIQSSGCTAGTNVNKVGDYKTSERLDASLVQGCDYSIFMALGNKDAGATVLKASYYKSATPFLVKKEDIAGKASYPASLALSLTTDGQAIGLSTGPQALPPQPQQPLQPVVTPQAVPNPSPVVPPAQLAALPATKDVELVTSAGIKTSLNAEFKGKYIVLDFSSSGCPPCKDLARRFNQDTARQKLLDGTVCSHATMLAEGDVGDWNAIFKGTASGKHAFGVVGGATRYASAKLGTSVTATPTLMIIDRTGKVVAKQVGGYPAEMNQLCTAN